MKPNLIIGLVGDYDATVPAHQAIPRTFELISFERELSICPQWIPTDEITDSACLTGVHALWCVPASPYRSLAGALWAIRFARENQVPFLGTCGGFQHAILEYARNVLGWTDAAHAEISPEAACLLISPLTCDLVEKSARVFLRPGSTLAEAYQSQEIVESYRCRYGLNTDFRSRLLTGPLTLSAEDEQGEVRAVELTDHPFFVATLFQPERAALSGMIPPLVKALVDAALVNHV